jgi:hypothetical protein
MNRPSLARTVGWVATAAATAQVAVLAAQPGVPVTLAVIATSATAYTALDFTGRLTGPRVDETAETESGGAA